MFYDACRKRVGVRLSRKPVKGGRHACGYLITQLAVHMKPVRKNKTSQPPYVRPILPIYLRDLAMRLGILRRLQSEHLPAGLLGAVQPCRWSLRILQHR